MDSATMTSIFSFVLSLLVAIFAQYNRVTQKQRDRMNDLKYEKYKKEMERFEFRRSENTAKVFGELWRVLHTLGADRVYIVQPHPLGNSEFLSIYFEVKRNGISGMKENVQHFPMSEMAVFSKSLAENLYLCYTDIDSQVKDKIAKSLFLSNGCHSVAIKRLNSARDWVGNIFCEFTDKMQIPETEIQKTLHEAAVNIQFILPEYRENPLK